MPRMEIRAHSHMLNALLPLGPDMDRVKSLESMNRVLEQPDEQEGGAEKSSHLAVLEKLHGMTLTTQEIIASKIGVVVSKLRKSRYGLVSGLSYGWLGVGY